MIKIVPKKHPKILFLKIVPEICISTLGRMHVAKIGPRALLSSVSNLPGCLGSSCRDQTHVSSFLCWFRYTERDHTHIASFLGQRECADRD